MNIRSVLHILGWLSLLLGLLLLIPLGIALYHERAFAGEVPGFVYTVALALLVGVFLKHFFRIEEEESIGASEGFAAVTFGWLLLVFLGAIPFRLSGACPNMVDSFFEIMSGFTTTGSTILTDIEGFVELYPGLMFWRSFSHWLGGMGIVALSVAVLPVLGAGGVMLFQAEITGPVKDRLSPKISATAKALWIIYTFLTLVETALLWMQGMPLYDAFCHAFGTMATGGFSTKTESIGFYGAGVQWTVIAFMFLAGVNFVLHFQFLRGNLGAVFTNRELWFYLLVLASSIVVIALVLHLALPREFLPGQGAEDYRAEAGYASPTKSFRDAAFQVVSIATTTGYCTENFDRWPYLCRWLLVLLMFGGACAGSTGGGIKLVRILLMVKAGFRELKRLAKPSALFNVKVGGQTVPEEILARTLGFFVLYFVAFIFCSIVLSFMGYDFETAFTAVLACISNIGPGLGGVGAVENYAHFSDAAKMMLTLCMLIGRLEIFAVLILLSPLTWRK